MKYVRQVLFVSCCAFTILIYYSFQRQQSFYMQAHFLPIQAAPQPIKPIVSQLPESTYKTNVHDDKTVAIYNGKENSELDTRHLKANHSQQAGDDIPDVEENTSSNITHSRQYLLPIFFYNAGPCGQYTFFKFGLSLAIYLNRSLVTIPFHNNHIHNVSIKRSIDETFDLPRLRKIVDLATTTEFIKECGRRFMVENVLLGLQIKKDNQQVFEKILHSYSTAGAFFQNVLNISLPERNAVEVYQRNNEASSIELSKRVKCLIFLANGGVEKKQQQEINVRIANGLKRAPYIRHAADIVVQQISDGSPYAVLHWRNKSGEFCRERTIHFCTEEMLDSLRILDRSIDVIADAILNITKSYNITSLYVAAPPYPHKMIGFLKQRIPTIKTEDDIILPDKMNKYKEDNYVWSLIEQEFTEKADLFLSSTGSNWSDFVTFFRSAMNKPSFRVKTLPGVEQATPDINI